MTIHSGIFILILVVVALIGGVAGWFAALGRTSHKQLAIQAQLADAQAETLRITGRADQLVQENTYLHEQLDEQHATAQALAPLSQQLGAVDSYVRALETKTAARFASLSNQLQIDAKISAQLSHTTESLNAMLRNSAMRGSWGEVQLRRIIEVAGMLERVDFAEQASTSQFSDTAQGNGRPDITVHLPNGAHIAIDAKVPMASYIAAYEIPETDIERAGERARLLAEHANAVKAHITTLKKRNYPGDFPQSPQLTIMFLPTEALLAQALDTDPQLLDYALADGIILTTPASLLALLRSIAAIWRSAQSSEQARDIVTAGQELVNRLAVVVNHLEKLGGSLKSSVTNYNKAISSLESRVLVTYRGFATLGEKAEQLGTTNAIIEPDKANVRQFSTPELTQYLDEPTQHLPEPTQHLPEPTQHLPEPTQHLDKESD